MPIKACWKADYKTTLKFFEVIKSLMLRTAHNNLYQHQGWTMVFTSAQCPHLVIITTSQYRQEPVASHKLTLLQSFAVDTKKSSKLINKNFFRFHGLDTETHIFLLLAGRYLEFLFKFFCKIKFTTKFLSTKIPENTDQKNKSYILSS